jgi:hypothetical protein
MSKLPPPSDTARLVMNTGTLSGIHVLDFGKIEPGALIQLKDGSTATVVKVEGKRLSRHGVIAGSVEIGRNGQRLSVSSADILTVLHPPATAAS